MIYIQSVVQSIQSNFTNPDYIITIFWKFISIISILIVSKLIVVLTDKTIDRLVNSRKNKFLNLEPRRADTLKKILHNFVSYSVYIICSLLILGQLGINVAPILAGAGIVGIAIGFGAQSLVKDMITGFLIIFDDQFGVGDIVEIDGFRGTVEEVGIRVTKLKSDSGEVLMIPNGNIKRVVNYSTYNTIATLDINISADSSVLIALQLLDSICDEMYKTDVHLVKRPEVQGIQLLGNHFVTLRIRIECISNKQNDVFREMNLIIKRKFDENRIELK